MPVPPNLRAKAYVASIRLSEAAERIAAERGISHQEALALVFADKELLKRCHDVGNPSLPSVEPEVPVITQK